MTIGGESAGAFSVCWHLASPLSAGLFHAAILESGTCDSETFFSSYADNRNWTNTFSGMLGCDPDAGGQQQLTCLRNLPTKAIIGHKLSSPGAAAALPQHEHGQALRAAAEAFAAQSSWGFLPKMYPAMAWSATIDGSSLPRMPLDQILNGTWNRVPLIAGTNNDEGSIFVPMLSFIVKGAHFPAQPSDVPLVVSHFFDTGHNETAQILAEYPLASYKDAETCLQDILRDFMFVCSSRRALRAAANQGVNTWLYHWSDTLRGDRLVHGRSYCGCPPARALLTCVHPLYVLCQVVHRRLGGGPGAGRLPFRGAGVRVVSKACITPADDRPCCRCEDMQTHRACCGCCACLTQGQCVSACDPPFLRQGQSDG